jgi:hypothetical protein
MIDSLFPDCQSGRFTIPFISFSAYQVLGGPVGRFARRSTAGFGDHRSREAGIGLRHRDGDAIAFAAIRRTG